MCGISGFSNFNQNYEAENKKWIDISVNMRNSLSHRGNDTTGLYLGKNVGLVQNRMVVKNTTGGMQPLVRTVNGKEYALIANGGLFNARELKQKLTGYTFEDSSDAEIILYGYLEYGIDFVNELNGNFSYAIWDGKDEKLVLVRDRVGVKPLFYSVYDNTLVFGSEIKALFQFPGIEPVIDLKSMKEVFGLGPAKSNSSGVFKNIYEIKPGHFAIYSKDGFREEQYWQFQSAEHKDSYEETLDKISYLIRDAVKRQSAADVEVCSFLSGGVDSSIVTALTSKYLGEKGKKLSTYSFDFKDNDVYFQSNAFQPHRDRPFVEIMLKEYDLNHTFLECNEAELADLLYKAVDARDMPGMADIDASLMYFCSLVGKNHKVAMTGECADEVFWGYPWFHKKELIDRDIFPWSGNIETRTMLLNEDFKNKLQLQDFVKSHYEDTLKEVPRLDGESPSDARLREINYVNIRWFMQTLLDRMDRMGIGVDGRVPFADHRLMEYLWNVPYSMKCKDGVVKNLLRESCKDLLPDELINRKKSPFPKTYNPNYENLLKQRVSDIINNPNSPVYPLIDKAKVLQFLDAPAEYGKPWFGQLMAAPQLMAYLIQVNYWLDKYGLSLNNI